MLEFLNNIPIRGKIAGFTNILLILILAAVSATFGLTLLKVLDVKQDLQVLARSLVPAADMVARIEVHTLEQEISFERILRHRTVGKAGGPEEVAAYAAFQKHGARVRTELTQAERLLKQALAGARTASQGAALGEVRASLTMLEREQKDYEQHVARYLERAQKFSATEDKRARSAMEKEEDEVDAQLSQTLLFLQKLAEGRTVAILNAQEHILWASSISLGTTLLLFGLGVLVTNLIAVRIVRPLRESVQHARALAGGKLDTQIPVRGRDEIAGLSLALNELARELQSKELIKATFGKYVDPRIVEGLLADESPVAREGERRIMSVFFSDIKGFSTISENLTPGGLVRLLNRYFTLMSGAITDQSGIIDKYIGDAIMAFWGPPFTSEHEHANLACRAMLRQRELLVGFNDEIPEILGFRQGAPKVVVRMGVCTGELLVGNIGSDNSRSFTVMGDTVNIASRLESACKQYGLYSLISDTTRALLGPEFQTREIDNIVVMGKEQPVRVFELLSDRALEPRAAQLRETFEVGLGAYRAQNWDGAERAFGECLTIDGEDGPAQVFLARTKQLRTQPPPSDWDGVWRLSNK